ncbi:hypothetical protein AB0M79_09725 [Polymorphospora sp. NPDC051019]|uniref:hypothetical protein n=1 Tax=Polymorphospora sp. NPDC051019 TaxID=3155725 RepID=UPI003412E71E
MDNLYVVRFLPSDTPSIGPLGDDEIDEEEQADEKTTFAYFGLAFYRASTLEHEIVNVLSMMRLVSARRDAENLLSDPWSSNFKATMGTLIKKLAPNLQDDPNLGADLVKALELRNHLAHAFWRERAVDFCTEEGRAKMIEFLTEARNTFADVDRRLTTTFGAKSMQGWGVTPEIIDTWYKDTLQKVASGELRLEIEQVEEARQALLARLAQIP